MLCALLPLAQIYLVYLVLLEDAHAVLEAQVEELINVLKGMEAHHLLALETDALAAWLGALEKALVVDRVVCVHSIAVV